MQTHLLAAHPDHPPAEVSRIEARVIGRDANWLRVRWRVEGSQQLVVPAFAGKGRADELWRTTCFELFLKPLGRGAPSRSSTRRCRSAGCRKAIARSGCVR